MSPRDPRAAVCRTRTAFFVVLVAAVLVRILMWLVYGPAESSDTGTYATLARQIQTLDFGQYTGARTPVYPVLMLLAYMDPVVIRAIQSMLGIGTSLVLFVLVIRTSGNPWVAVAAGLAHSFALNQLYWEASVVTESLATFLVVLSVYALMRSLGPEATATDGALLGLVASLAVLTRPLFVYLGPLYLIFLAVGTVSRAKWRVIASCGAAFAVPVVGWALFNAATINYFGLTTLVGYNLSQHSGGFIEKAPDRYATIRDIYLEHREARRREKNTHSMAIFTARHEIKAKLGLSDIGLSRELTKMSVELFRMYPGLYAKSVARSWTRFWSVPDYWWDDVQGRAAAAFRAACSMQRYILVAMNAVFIVAAGYSIVAWLRSRPIGPLGLVAMMGSVVIAASVTQAPLEFGENGRYAIPTQPLVAAVVILTCWELATRRWGQRVIAQEARR